MELTDDMDVPKAFDQVQVSDMDSSKAFDRVQVDEKIWRYMTRSSNFSHEIDAIRSECGVCFESERGQLKIGENDIGKLETAKQSIQCLIRKCLETTQIIRLPQNDQVLDKLNQHRETDEDYGDCEVLIEGGEITLIGTQSEIDQCLKRLEDLFEIQRNANTEDDRSCSWNNDEERSDENDGPVVVTLDTEVWRYLQKNEKYTHIIKKITEYGQEGVVCMDYDDKVNITFQHTGRGEVKATLFEIQKIVDQSRTIHVKCPDEMVYMRISRLLSAINRSYCYVTVSEDPNIVSITGDEEERRKCLERLESYGLKKGMEIPQVPRERNEDLLTEPQNDPSITMTPEDINSKYVREFPVPIEEHLWTYIEKKCQTQLMELLETMGVRVSGRPSNIPRLVTLYMHSDTEDLLDCATDAFGQLVNKMEETIMVGVVDLSCRGTVSKKFREGLELQCSGTETIFEIQGNNVYVIGPSYDMKLCQQRIAAYVQQPVDLQPGSEGSDPPMESTPRNGSTTDYQSHEMGSGYHREKESESSRIPDNSTNVKLDKRVEDKLAGGEFGHASLGHQNQNTWSLGHQNQDGGGDEFIDRNDMSSGNGRSQTDGQTSYTTDARQSTLPTTSTLHSLDPHGGRGATKSNHTENESSRCAKACSICRTSGRPGPEGNGCNHRFCVSCIGRHFSEVRMSECPLCGGSDEGFITPTQPSNGEMLISYNNSFRLPGYEDSSSGTITVTYIFPAGTQTVDHPNPGKRYPAMTSVAFFPLCREGNSVVDSLQRAFQKRLVFRIDSNGNLVWNGLLHKVNVFAGEDKLSGYPDEIYLRRIRSELDRKGIC